LLLHCLLSCCCGRHFLLLLLHVGLPGVCGSLQQLRAALCCEGLLGVLRVKLQ
jgi:hypothetical protein